jgi:tetratricopeptide (TPR) repeat protein
MCQRALSILEKKLPPDHPDLAYPLLGIGRALVRLNHGDAAFRALDRARELREKTKGGDVSEPLLELGVLYLAQRNAKAAVTVLERALASASPLAGGDIHLALADGLWQTGSDRPRARELAEWARAYYERIGHRPGLDRSTRWLTDHPAPHS